MGQLDDVRGFHSKMGLHTADPYSGPTLGTREKLVAEEYREFKAELPRDKFALLLEACDLIYTVHGALVERGFTQSDFDVAWAMVHRANMTKKPRSDGSGKVQKPADFEPVTPEQLREVLKDSRRHQKVLQGLLPITEPPPKPPNHPQIESETR